MKAASFFFLSPFSVTHHTFSVFLEYFVESPSNPLWEGPCFEWQIICFFFPPSPCVRNFPPPFNWCFTVSPLTCFKADFFLLVITDKNLFPLLLQAFSLLSFFLNRRIVMSGQTPFFFSFSQNPPLPVHKSPPPFL